MIERKISLRQVIQTRRASYQSEQRLRNYIIGRGLFKGPSTNQRSERGAYLRFLPKLSGKNVIEIIEEKSQEVSPVKILDVGCGNGRFLIDCKRKWQDKVECTGISAYLYHLEDRKWELGAAGKTVHKLEELEIQILQMDAQSFVSPSKLKPESYDVVVSVMTSQYLADPAAMLKSIYRVLRIGGVGLVERPMPMMTASDRRLLAEYLEREYGMEFIPGYWYQGVAFRKSRERLTLPISTVGPYNSAGGPGKIFYGFNH